MKALVVLVALVGAGCALTSKSAPLPVRYFTPEAANVRRMDAPRAAPATELRLGQVNAAAYIREKIVYRTSAHELGFHERWRWSEDTEATVKRALARSLFQEHGLRQAVSGAGPVLEVDIDTFEDRQGPRRVAHVDLTWRLRDAKVVLAQRTVTVERPITHRGAVTGTDVANGLARVLAEAMDHVVDEVLAELATAPVGDDRNAMWRDAR